MAGVQVLDDEDRRGEISRELGDDLEKGYDPARGRRDRNDVEGGLSLWRTEAPVLNTRQISVNHAPIPSTGTIHLKTYASTHHHLT